MLVEPPRPGLIGTQGIARHQAGASLQCNLGKAISLAQDDLFKLNAVEHLRYATWQQGQYIVRVRQLQIFPHCWATHRRDSPGSKYSAQNRNVQHNVCASEERLYA